MKIKPEHLDHIKKEIEKFLENNPRIVEDYEQGKFHRSHAVQILQKRFCFDLMYNADLSGFVSSTLYDYMNDDHIYTALKSICPKVIRKY